MSEDQKTEQVEKTGRMENPTKELGVSNGHITNGFLYDEFLPQLRGRRGIKIYRQMRDNDPIVGALITALTMMIRAVEWRVEPADDTPQAEAEREFVESLFDDMSHTFEDFMDQVLSFLPFGFSFFEIVMKRRSGPLQTDPSRRSKYTDGRLGIRKLAPRPQWTLDDWEQSPDGGVEAFLQQVPGGRARIPIQKGLLFRTATAADDPSGRSVLRNAYRSWYFSRNIEEIEAIAIERELNGIPVGRIPSEYLSKNASSDQRNIRDQFEQMLRDVKFNEQGYILLPSDLIQNDDGSYTGERMVEFELMSSSGTRAIDMDKVIQRHQSNMARTVLADFVMLGQSERGSFALSKSKSDLFLKSLEGYLNSIAAVINRHLLPRVFLINGISHDLLPKMVPGDVAPVDLEELGNYIQRLSGSGLPLFPDKDLEDTLRSTAGLPESQDDPEAMGIPDAPSSAPPASPETPPPLPEGDE